MRALWSTQRKTAITLHKSFEILAFRVPPCRCWVLSESPWSSDGLSLRENRGNNRMVDSEELN